MYYMKIIPQALVVLLGAIIISLSFLQSKDLFSFVSRESLLAAPLASLSQNCFSLKYTSPLDKSINVVFVPSGFKGNLTEYYKTVKATWQAMQEFSVYNRDIRQLNVLYTNKELNRGESFCAHNIPGLASQFMICGPLKAKQLSSQCAKNNVYTIVIDNTSDYAGSGLWMFDLATASINSEAAYVAAHELAHSIFGFGDEYTDKNNFYSTAKTVANCDVAGCPKWNDLIDGSVYASIVNSSQNIQQNTISQAVNTITTDLKLGCYPNSCTGGKYYSSGENTMMRSNITHLPFTPAQDRVACCAYKKVSGEYPPALCGQFNNKGKALDTVCASDPVEQGRRTLRSAQQFRFNILKGDWDIDTSKTGSTIYQK